MKKYKVEVYYDQIEYYNVEAESEEDAIKKVQESTDLKPDEAHDASWEAQSAREIANNSPVYDGTNEDECEEWDNRD